MSSTYCTHDYGRISKSSIVLKNLTSGCSVRTAATKDETNQHNQFILHLKHHLDKLLM